MKIERFSSVKSGLRKMRYGHGLKYIFLFCVCACGYAINVSAEIGVGSSKEEVIEVYGQPLGVAANDASELLMYEEGVIEVSGGEVIAVDERFGASAFVGIRRKQEKDKATKSAHDSFRAVTVIKEDGKKIDLDAVLTQGKITILDFYADWCPPCRSIGPQLQKLAESDREVCLVKIDIKTWGTPVSQQFNLKNIPNIRVFDRYKKMVGKPTSNFADVEKNVTKAKSVR